MHLLRWIPGSLWSWLGFFKSRVGDEGASVISYKRDLEIKPRSTKPR